VLAAIHPRVLNPLLQLAGRLKGKTAEGNQTQFQIQRYPFRPLLGELGFVTLRGIGFLCTIPALQALAPAQLPAALAAFSIAWVLGLVVPGAPGGIGVFEATALALLRGQLPVGVILGVVALYRVISILAEVIGAGLAYGWTHRTRQ
jgi:glycosyltransferase 2 family protein